MPVGVVVSGGIGCCPFAQEHAAAVEPLGVLEKLCAGLPVASLFGELDEVVFEGDVPHVK